MGRLLIEIYGSLCLFCLNDKFLKGSDKGMIAGMILTDLKKAFDTIDHDLLLQKL